MIFDTCHTDSYWLTSKARRITSGISLPAKSVMQRRDMIILVHDIMHPVIFRGLSPYAYAAWNPVNRIDPDGRDWYEAEDGTSALWKNSNDASINLNGVSYNNIGANYNHTVGNTTHGYHQNELASVTTDAMSGDNYISQFSKEDWNGTPAMKACNKACDAMLASAGFASSEHKNKNIIVENDGTGRAGIANNNAESIIGKMTDMLYAGIPSKACVDIRQGSSSADKIGDHFIVIMGIKEFGHLVGLPRTRKIM